MINEAINSAVTIMGDIIINYGALGVFLASLAEEVIAPIPSSVVIIGSSFFIMTDPTITLASLGKLFFVIALPAAFGVTLGSLLFYGITYFAGRPFIERWGKYLGLSWQDIQELDKRFDESYTDEILIFALRVIPITPSIVINAFCGFIRYDIKKYLIITFFGTLLRVFMLGFIGWQFGNIYQNISQQFSAIETWGIILIVMFIIGIIIYLRKRMQKKSSG
jgi:membrane protein DedA with SNARE-associated domain